MRTDKVGHAWFGWGVLWDLQPGRGYFLFAGWRRKPRYLVRKVVAFDG